ncbi:hypothetical protein F4780DRAFT_627858 [Xylariomycetidae sp. FL0641]|nr:hypothetical protein F4780DRAFT_627858 [Xylariomycetidae sp. FL0641]
MSAKIHTQALFEKAYDQNIDDLQHLIKAVEDAIQKEFTKQGLGRKNFPKLNQLPYKGQNVKDKPDAYLMRLMTNWVFFFGATFNPPHEAHLRLLKDMWEAFEKLAEVADNGIHLAGAIVGCSDDADVAKKTKQRKSKQPYLGLSNEQRVNLWWEGGIKDLNWATLSPSDNWAGVWSYVEAVKQAQKNHFPEYPVTFVRVRGIDKEKDQFQKAVVSWKKEEQLELDILLNWSAPGSGEVSKAAAGNEVGMGITVLTEEGKKGTFFEEGAKVPTDLVGYRSWVLMKELRGGSQLWRCEHKEKTWKQPDGKDAPVEVWYLHRQIDENDPVTELHSSKIWKNIKTFWEHIKSGGQLQEKLGVELEKMGALAPEHLAATILPRLKDGSL